MNILFILGLTVTILLNLRPVKSNQNVIMKTKQEIRGGNSNSFNRNVGQSYVINVNKMGSSRNMDDDQDQEQSGLLPPALLPAPQQMLPPSLIPPALAPPQALPPPDTSGGMAPPEQVTQTGIERDLAIQQEFDKQIAMASQTQPSNESPIERDIRLVQEAERLIAEASKSQEAAASSPNQSNPTPDGSSAIEQDLRIVEETNRLIAEAERNGGQSPQSAAAVQVPDGSSGIERDILLVQESNRLVEEALRSAPKSTEIVPDGSSAIERDLILVQEAARAIEEAERNGKQPQVGAPTSCRVPDGSSDIERDAQLVQEANRKIEEAQRTAAQNCQPIQAQPESQQLVPQTAPVAVESQQQLAAPAAVGLPPLQLDQNAHNPITGILPADFEVVRAESLLDKLTI
jgi:hypothetical protein